MNQKTIGCIGIGAMGGSLVELIAQQVNPSLIFVNDVDSKKLDSFCSKIVCNKSTSNIDLASSCDVLLLAVKPQFIDSVLVEIAQNLKKSCIVISMVAGKTIASIQEKLLGHTQIIRIMPNLPVKVGSGLIALAYTAHVSQDVVDYVSFIFSKAGLLEKTEENLMNAVTAVSGSGPAYGYVFIDALADAAVKMGMQRDQAIRYAAQTLKGAATMVLETQKNPNQLKDEVCSPAGTTIAGVTRLDECGFRNAVIQAALAAWNRANELG